MFFCDRLYKEEELPDEFKLYLPLKNKKVKPAAIKKGAAEQAADTIVEAAGVKLADIAAGGEDAVAKKLSKLSLHNLDGSSVPVEQSVAPAAAPAPEVAA